MACRRFSSFFFLVRFFPTPPRKSWEKPPGNSRNRGGGMSGRSWPPGRPACRPTNPVESRHCQGPGKPPPPQGSRGADQADTRGRFSAGARRGLDCALALPGLIRAALARTGAAAGPDRPVKAGRTAMHSSSVLASWLVSPLASSGHAARAGSRRGARSVSAPRVSTAWTSTRS